jgi:aminoglycoside phosphotransferase family enzyme/cytidylate kinase
LPETSQRLRPGEITEDQSEAIALLSDPATHGGAPVKRIDTHGATVILAGDRAIKLKRAVWFPYMDFSTSDRRRAACEAEIRVNRRTAPQIYRACRPITRRPDGRLEIGGDGAAVDWVVVMTRFDQAGLFDRLAQRGALTPELMLDLADAVARFHGAAERRRDHGGRDGIEAVIDGNTEELEAVGATLFAAAEVAALDAAARAALDRVGERLDRRRAEGFVRHCHGDLHLRNICLFDGRPTLFDAIEFNPAIACIDVFYDLAFLLMDLEHRALRPLGNAVFNRYVARTGDLGALKALPLFLSCRAGVRAQVGAAAAARQAEAAMAARLRREARAYFELAQAFLEPPAPRLVAVGGWSGSGKSTLAHRLAPALGAAPGAVVLRSDVIRKRLMGVDMFARLPEEAYLPEVSRRVFQILDEQARAALAAGHAVVADAVFQRPELRADLDRIAWEARAPFTGIWLEVPPEVQEQRLGGRAADASDATVRVGRQQRASALGALAWHRLDARGDPDRVAAAARALLDR